MPEDRIRPADRIRKLLRLAGKKTERPDLTSIDKTLVLRLSGHRLPNLRQLKYLPRFMGQRDRRLMAVLLAIAAVGLSAIAVRAVSDLTEVVPKAGGNYTEAVVGSVRYINPVLSAANDADSDLIALIFSGLMRFDEDGRLLTDLAESREVSADGLTYTFTLRQLAEWHDGTAVTSADVAATFGYIKNPAWNSPWRSRFSGVAVETPDERTVRFVLTEPHAPFLSYLTIGIMPSHLWNEVMPENAARAELNIKPIGSGPFRLKSAVKDRLGAVKSLTLARNERHYGQRPHLETVTFRYYQSYDLAAEAFLSDRVDGLAFLTPEAKDQIGRLRTVILHGLHIPQYTAVFFNQANNPSLRSKDVRQALTMAIDRQALIREVLGGQGTPIHGPLLPGFPGFRTDAKRYVFNAEKAGQLLDQAGYTKNDSGQRAKSTKVDGQTAEQPLEIALTAVDSREGLAVAEAVAASWERLGIKVSLDAVPAQSIGRDRIRTREFEALIYGAVIGPDVDPFPFWHSSQRNAPGLNLSGYNHRRSDELLELGRKAVSESVRGGLYGEFHEILAEEAPAVFLYSPTYSYAVRREVKGVHSVRILSPSDRLAGIAGWYVKTKRVWR